MFLVIFGCSTLLNTILELEERFPHCEVREFDNYYIVTNV